MMGLSHVLTGTAVGLGVSLAPGLRDLPPESRAALVSTCGGFAVVPDLDHPNSSISRFWGPVSGGVRARIWGRRRRVLWGITDVVCAVSGGHRRGTHTVDGMAVFLFGVWVASWTRPTTAFVLGLVTGISYAAFCILMGWAVRKHAIENLALSGFVAWASYTQGWRIPWWLVAAMALGILAHIGGDMLTVGKCPLSWWDTKTKIGLGWFVTNGPFERWVMRPLVLIPANALPLLYLIGYHPIGAAWRYFTT